MNTQNPPALLQLQLWDARQCTYKIVAPTTPRSKAWRIARTDRPLKPVYNTPRYTASTHDVSTVQGRYCEWAIAKGLKVITVFKDKPIALGLYYGEIRRVDADDYFAVETSVVDELLT